MRHALLTLDLSKSFVLQPGGVAVNKTYGNFASFLNLLLPNIMVFAGIILFLLLVFGGFTIIASAGNPKGTEQGKQAITGAIIGFLVIFAAYWIIQIIQVITGVQIFNSTL